MRDPADALDDPNCLGPSKWWLACVLAVQGMVVVALVVLLTGCGLAVGAIGGMSTVSGAISGIANKAYETAVWGFDGPPARLRGGHYMNQDMYGG